MSKPLVQLLKYRDASQNNQAHLKGFVVKALLKLDLTKHKCKITRVYFADDQHQINCDVQYDDPCHRTITEQIILDQLREKLNKVGYSIDATDFQLKKLSISPQCTDSDFDD